VLTSYESGGSNAVVLPGTSLGSGNTLYLELMLAPAGETAFTFGTGFVATPPLSSPELIIRDALYTPLLMADLIGTAVTGMAPGPAGQTTTSVTLGDVSLLSQHLVLTGGTLAGDFGGVGAIGVISVLLNRPSVDFAFGSFFDQDFTAQMNVQLQFTTPEPGTGLLVALPLAGLAWWRRRTRAAR